MVGNSKTGARIWCALMVGLFLLGCSTPKVNFRFALKNENYKEVQQANRLKTNKTEVTSQYFQMEGPAWENENIAFRNYFDERNGMDIFGKKTAKMILDSVGIRTNYHEMQPWGMDILKVGNSLGSGGIGLIIGDTLYRIGPKGDGSFKLLEESKKLVRFELLFDEVKILDRNYHISHIISIKPNTFYFENSLAITGLQGDEVLAVGIVDHIKKVNHLSDSNRQILYTHGTQTMQNETLGMAIETDSEYFMASGHTQNFKGEVTNSHLMQLKLSNDTPTQWKFYAVWDTSHPQFGTEESFISLMKTSR